MSWSNPHSLNVMVWQFKFVILYLTWTFKDVKAFSFLLQINRYHGNLHVLMGNSPSHSQFKFVIWYLTWTLKDVKAFSFLLLSSIIFTLTQYCQRKLSLAQYWAVNVTVHWVETDAESDKLLYSWPIYFHIRIGLH